VSVLPSRRPTAAEVGIAAAAAMLLPAARVAVAVVPLRTLLRALPASARSSIGVPPARVEEIVAGVARRSPLATSCLHRALASLAILRMRGVRAQLVIGVDPGASALAAHAWIDLGGDGADDRTALRLVPWTSTSAPAAGVS
jgi:hypothetical protein